MFANFAGSICRLRIQFITKLSPKLIKLSRGGRRSLAPSPPHTHPTHTLTDMLAAGVLVCEHHTWQQKRRAAVPSSILCRAAAPPPQLPPPPPRRSLGRRAARRQLLLPYPAAAWCNGDGMGTASTGEGNTAATDAATSRPLPVTIRRALTPAELRAAGALRASAFTVVPPERSDYARKASTTSTLS